MAQEFYKRGDNGSYEYTEAGAHLRSDFEAAVRHFLWDRFGDERDAYPTSHPLRTCINYDVLDVRSIMEGALAMVMMNEGIRRRLS
jgi:hypothetical protein